MMLILELLQKIYQFMLVVKSTNHIQFITKSLQGLEEIQVVLYIKEKEEMDGKDQVKLMVDILMEKRLNHTPISFKIMEKSQFTQEQIINLDNLWSGQINLKSILNLHILLA